jgi:cell division protein FtsB
MSQIFHIWNVIGKYKYLITIIGFVVLIGFLDENSMVRRAGYTKEIHDLKTEIKKYRTEYDESTKQLNQLATNPEFIEHIAREKYRMKKPNEDVFILEKK